MSLSAPWTTRSRIAGMPRTRTLRPRPSGSPSSVPAWADTCVRPVRPGSAPGTPPRRRLDGRERDPVDARGPVVLLGHLVGFVERLHLADVDVQSPETPSRFSLRLDVYPPSQVLQTDGRFCHRPCLPVVGGVHEQQGPFAPRALPRFVATTGPSATLSPSAHFPGCPGYTAYLAPPISRRGEEGFSSCSTRPCHRAAALTPPECPAAPASLRRPMLPSPSNRARPPGLRPFEATSAFTFVAAR